MPGSGQFKYLSVGDSTGGKINGLFPADLSNQQLGLSSNGRIFNYPVVHGVIFADRIFGSFSGEYKDLNTNRIGFGPVSLSQFNGERLPEPAFSANPARKDYLLQDFISEDLFVKALVGSISHEFGHSLGLKHLNKKALFLMKEGGEYLQASSLGLGFSKTSQPLINYSNEVQNDKSRLGQSVGSDTPFQRDPPPKTDVGVAPTLNLADLADPNFYNRSGIFQIFPFLDPYASAQLSPGTELEFFEIIPDPDGYLSSILLEWQISDDGVTWRSLVNESRRYTVKDADAGKHIRAYFSYTDGRGLFVSSMTNSANVSVDSPPVNDGAATFSISGSPAVGNTLTAYVTTADPDGNGSGGFSYGWQTSADGTSWSSVGTNSPSYLVASADQGKQLRLNVTYTDAEGFAESPTLPYGKLQELPASASGTRFTVSDPLSPALQITSQGSPDLVELQVAVSATLHARTSSTWSSGFVAYNAGSPTAPGTGERISVTGLGRYAFVATAIPEATTAIVLEPNQNSAYFLHDTYSAFFSSLSLEPDRYGRASAQRLLNIDTITMGSAGGTSIVDLTSPDYITSPMTVLGAASGNSIVWGSGADDTYISAGSDAVIFGGLGSNTYTLGSGRETLQYRQMGGGIGAKDQIRGFYPSIDRLQFWAATDQLPSTPSLVNNLTSSVLAWGGHTIEFLDQPGLSLADLTILQATAI
jgi:hypothetical protein